MSTFRAVDHIFETEDQRTNILTNVFSSNTKFSVYVTGGAGSVLSWLLSTPGCSASLLEGGVPYACSSMHQFLGVKELDSACSAETARLIAKQAFCRTTSILLQENKNFQDLVKSQLYGICCTAALVTNRKKLGPHRAYIGAYSNNNFKCYTLNMKKDIRTRTGEDELCSKLILHAIQNGRNMDEVVDEANETEDCVSLAIRESRDPFQRLYNKECSYILLVESQHPSADGPFAIFEDVHLPAETLIFPGSFNPLHEGHIAMVAAALRAVYQWSPDSGKVNPPVVFELAVLNADKPPIPIEEAKNRAAQFLRANQPLLDKYNLTNIAFSLTSEPLFVSKSRLFSGCNFLVGADTLTRILDAKYYGTPESGHYNMIHALSTVCSRSCRFIVGGRLSKDAFETLDSIVSQQTLPDDIRRMFIGLSSSDYRMDISSTEIRNAAKKKLAEANA